MKFNLTIQDLSFRFSPVAQQFFNKVNLEFGSKNIIFVQGANGSGKSTLFRLLQGSLEEGEELTGIVSIDDESYDLSVESTRKMLQKLVYSVKQDYNSMIADQFNFEENLRFALLPRYPLIKMLPDYNPFPELTKRFRIDLKQPAYLLSGGQRQILAILMVLQKQPALLMLDEPTAALDPINTAMVFAFLSDLVSLTNITILIITHDQSVIEAHASNKSFTIMIDSKTGERTIR